MNEYFELILDIDLQSNESWDTQILLCPTCGALFGTKACGNRTIFPWFGYHPTDGNCMVITDDVKVKIAKAVDNCDCTAKLQWVNNVKMLISSLSQYL